MPISMVPSVGQMPNQLMRAATENMAGAGKQGQGVANVAQGPANAGATAQPGSYHALELVPTGAPSGGPLAQMTSSMLGQVHGQVETLSNQLPTQLRASARDEVSVAKEGLAPQQDSINPSRTPKGAGKDDAVGALSKTFDHAIFMAMVNQVISGVGDTQRTLIRQS